MTPIELLGWTAAVVGMASTLPQVGRLIRARTSAGLSLALWQSSTGVAAAWVFRGVEVGQLQMIVANAVLLATMLLVVHLIVSDRGESLLRALVAPALLTVGLSAVDLLAGGVAFGLVIAVPSVWGQLAQLRFMRRMPDLSGVSGVYLGIAVVVQVLWLLWGLAVPEWSIVVCATLMGALCLVNLLYFQRRAAGLRLGRSGEPAFGVA